MKKILLASVFVFLTGCYGIKENAVTGTLEISAQSGVTSLNFIDAKTRKVFSLISGNYTLKYVSGVALVRPAVIEIRDMAGVLIGSLGIPRSSLNRDDSFEIYEAKKGKPETYNIYGGLYKVYQSRNRFEKLRASCTYEESYGCYDSDGEWTTCTTTRWGTRDEVWEHAVYKKYYQLRFENADQEVLGVFRGEAPWVSEDKIINWESCS